MFYMQDVLQSFKFQSEPKHENIANDVRVDGMLPYIATLSLFVYVCAHV